MSTNGDETTPLPPSQTTLIVQALQHVGNASLEQTAAIRSLQDQVGKVAALLGIVDHKTDEISQEFKLAKRSDLSADTRLHIVIGRAVVNVGQHKLFPWITAGLLGAWHVARTWFHG